MEHNITVLLVEDTQAIATEVYDFLEAQGMVVDYAATGRQGVALALQAPYDVVVLDVMLPDISGIEVCELIKRQCDPEPPVIMLTARDSIEDKSHGFEAGADDYLTKPFALVELHLRCKALARRQQLHLSQETTIGDLVVNEKQQKAARQNIPLKMSQTDFAILMLLVKAYPNAVSRQQVVNKIWGEESPDSDVLRSHVYTLRQALDKPFDSPMLKTIHGIGFKLEAQ